ncbi:uncharacterized protein BDR25DRAFT_311850 [Lindgomyces ingoldianus]|uniref:Uncharacterized protein n=1 Tax=Lindgomyces ingoldianus TaxID=673940 RepID=A0ACB6R306_9PLEO|nr:uncharacterized protein BDR25DRAFT_311850 [Lindgomyces ingoldianus]KAF2473634.1 hypothetical protein BDR25DRAFT_311850 [Lindgomyces ingoldianus]
MAYQRDNERETYNWAMVNELRRLNDNLDELRQISRTSLVPRNSYNNPNGYNPQQSDGGSYRTQGLIRRINNTDDEVLTLSDRSSAYGRPSYSIPSSSSQATMTSRSSNASKRERALNGSDRVAKYLMAGGTAAVPFSLLDLSGTTTIASAGVAAVGGALQLAVWFCKKCNRQYERAKVSISEKKASVKHRMGLCDGCWRCMD